MRIIALMKIMEFALDAEKRIFMEHNVKNVRKVIHYHLMDFALMKLYAIKKVEMIAFNVNKM